MADRLRSGYRRYLFYRRLRLIVTAIGGLFGLIICTLMYRNLVQNRINVGRTELIALLGTMAVSVVIPWLAVTPWARKPSEI